MIVVATVDFEIYHDVVNELHTRGSTFRTVEPAEPLPASTAVVITDADTEATFDDVPTIVAEPADPRAAVDRALSVVRGDSGRTVVGVDPGQKPGIAVVVGDTVVAAFQVPPSEVADVIAREVEDATDAVVRIGDGARLVGAKLVADLEAVEVELVDETGTTPYLGTGCRGMGDVLAAVNIARREGEPIEQRDVEPTAGELQRIKDRSRVHSDDNRTIDDGLARRVAVGELSIEEALTAHRERDETTGTKETE